MTQKSQLQSTLSLRTLAMKLVSKSFFIKKKNLEFRTNLSVRNKLHDICITRNL